MAYLPFFCIYRYHHRLTPYVKRPIYTIPQYRHNKHLLSLRFMVNAHAKIFAAITATCTARTAFSLSFLHISVKLDIFRERFNTIIISRALWLTRACWDITKSLYTMHLYIGQADAIRYRQRFYQSAWFRIVSYVSHSLPGIWRAHELDRLYHYSDDFSPSSAYKL